MVVPSTLFLYCSVQRIGDNWFISPVQSHKKQLAKFTELWSGERLGKRAVCSLYWPFEKHPTPTSRYHPFSPLFAAIFRILVRPVTSRSMPQRFCVPHIWQLISNELFSAHKKSSYRTKSGCFIHTAWMIVGLWCCDPLPFSLSLSVLPKCYPPLPQLFLKQRQQASGTKELLTKCKVIPQPDRCPSWSEAWHDGSSWWSVQLSHRGMYRVLFAPPGFSLLAARSRMNFTGQAGVYEDLSVLTLARLRTWLSSHQHRVMFGVRTAWNEARALSSPRLPSNITPKTDGYD